MEFGENGAVIDTDRSDRSDTISEDANYRGYHDGPRSALGLYRWFRWGFIAFLALSVVLAVLSLMVVVSPGMFSAIIDEFSYDFTPLDTVMTVASLAYIPVYIFCIVMTCRMTYRTMRNLHTINGRDVKNSPAMSVGYYFIPFANLVMPPQVTSDIYRGTMAATGKVVRNGMISVWWACWLVSSIVDRLSFNLGYGIESTAVSLVAIIVSMISAFILMRLFRDIAYAQEDLKHGGVADVFA
jgi:hypothetical protein